jgi:hypothetical protein
MKKSILFFSIIIFHLLVFSQKMNIFGNSPPFESRSAFLPCIPEYHCYYYEDEIKRKPMQDFQFQKLHFETKLDYYLFVSIDIDASRMVTINIKDNYFERTTTILKKMYKFQFVELLNFLARCDFDSFQEEAVEDASCSCSSFIEITFNGQVVRARRDAFYPIDDKDLRFALSKNIPNPISQNRVVIGPDY